MYVLGFVVFIIIYPILAFLIMWIIGKISPKRKIATKKRLLIAFVPNTVLYILLVGWVGSEKYIYTGLHSLGNAYDIAFPLNYASKIEYPPEHQRGDDFSEIKYINFIGNISNKAIMRMDALCEETNEMLKASKNVITHYPVPSNNPRHRAVYNPKNITRGWSKDGDIYYYSSDNECGTWYYFFSIDIATNTAVVEVRKW